MKTGDKVRVHQVNERLVGCEGIITSEHEDSELVLVQFPGDSGKRGPLVMYRRELDVINASTE